MWTANIQKKDFSNGTLRVIVRYENDTDSFEETYYLKAANEIENNIRSRLSQLASFETVSIPLGPYVPQPVAVSQNTPLQIALSNLNRLKTLVDVGVIKDTDTVYQAALLTAKEQYDLT